MSGATFPLIPRRRVLGLPFGGLHSMRRGLGSDVAGSRPYQPGDDIDRIDWHASARLSLARGTEEFIVREHYADEAPRVVVLCDRRPSMSIFDDSWPWLRKPEAIRQAVRVIGDSAAAARGLVGYFDEGDGSAYWHPPRSSVELGLADVERPFEAPKDTLARGLGHLVAQRRDLPAGSFVFVLSDFLHEPTHDEWLNAVERRWEIVPVVIQDPVWEQSFPEVGGTVVPFADPESGRVSLVRFSEDEVGRLREANGARLRDLLHDLRARDMDPVVLSSHESREIVLAFLTWADQRLFTRGRA
ncbi:MAG: DUF58 domain-containing protein [Actinobacteria bacterium]|nr:DUF58 domain-containing protein [Actinomycetota bacterium]